MKIIFRSAALAALLIIAACGKDDANSNENQSDEQAELLENTPLEINSVSDNVLIEGSTKEDGVSPTPNGAISLDVSDTSKTALLNEGFDISLSSDGDAIGAYLRFKAEDGTVANSYYDIDMDANSINNKAGKRTSMKFRNSNTKVSKIDDTSLNIGFNTTIEPGTFCYELCVYDAQGNISNPQEVCLTVESWGGFAAAVGSWNMVKEEKTYEDGSVATYLLGEENCDLVAQYTCDNGETLESSDNCITIKKENLIINADGTYRYEYDEDYKYLNSTQSKAECEAVFEDDSYIENSIGKWAYVAEDGNLIFIEHSYETLADDGSGELETETYEIGEGEVLFDGDTEFSDNSFVAYLGSFKIFFEK